MKKFTKLLTMLLLFIGVSLTGQDMVITGVYDGPLSGGTPKGVELYVINDIVDISNYGLGSANNGGGSDGEEFTFPADSYLAGDFIYVSSEDVQFLSWFGFDTDYTSGAMAINGDDAVELFMDGNVIDVYGDINVDGTGQPWEYMDGWAYRVSGTGPDGTTFVLANFTYSGPNALDGETTNATAAIPFPTGTYTAGASTTVATPSITPASGDYFAPITVSMTCATTDAIIYYTLDGTDPDETSTVFSTSFSVSTTTTVKARAYKSGMTESNIATNNYNFPSVIDVSTIADLRAQTVGSGDYYKLTGEAILTFQQSFRYQKYIQDATAGILIDDSPGAITTTYDIYDGITNIVGVLSEYGGMLQFVPNGDPGAPSSTANTITPEVVTLTQLTNNFEDYEAELVMVEDVVFADAGATFANGTEYVITDAGNVTYNFRTTFYSVDYIGTVIPTESQNIVILPNSRTDGEFITSRDIADFSALSTAARIVGSMQGWNTTDPDYVMTLNVNGLYELTKTLDAGDHLYKVIEGDDWTDPNYPGTDQVVALTATEDVTWKTNVDADLVTHMLPVVAGNFLEVLGGVNWDPTELIGEMSDDDGDDIFTLELVIPEGSYEGKVTLNQNWDQNTGGNVPFTTDGVNATVFTFDFPNNTTTISGPPPPSATITFVVDDSEGMNYNGFYLKGSWDEFGNYDPSWGDGAEHSAFFDDGTNGDETADDHIWTCQFDLTSDGGSNTWEWGVNDAEHNWVAGNWQFSVTDGTPQTLSWTVPASPYVIVNEIMYNSPGTDEEWVELYNDTDAAIDLEGWKILDDNANHTPIEITAGYSIPANGYFTIMIATDGFFPFTPDFDGTGNFALNNGGDVVRVYNSDGMLIDFVEYDDGGDWPSQPDGDGPSLSLITPDLDNSLGESWAASSHDGGSPAAYNFPIVVTAPNGGEIIELDSYFDITWTLTGWDGDIKIELIREGQNPELLVSGIPASDETYSWYVFESLEVANDYKILISGLEEDEPFDESDDFFSIMEHYDIPLLVLTEIMYNPPESGNDSLEFLEIYNNGEELVNLEGIYFSQGIEYVFPSVEILPDTFLLLSIDSLVMMETFNVEAFQWTAGALSNGGEAIEMKDMYDNVIDFVEYDDALPWDTLADGQGPSLTLCNPDADNNVAENWTHSVNFVAVNSVGDSIWATPGFGCQVSLFASFEADITFLSVGNGVMFTDLTVGDATEWTWTFEGGTPDTWSGQTPPEIIYNEVGLWDVTLFVSDGVNTDEVIIEEYIEVVEFTPPTNLQAVVGPYDDVQLTWNVPAGDGFEDDFESYDDFAIDFSPWTNIDVDGSTTYGMTDIDWPNAFAEQSFIIFNPLQTTPPVDDIIPHSGDKLAACFAATAPPNDDWLVTPMVNVAAGSNLSFWAKSYTADYGLERFRVGVSTTGMDPADFTIISEGDYVEAPVEEWTEFNYDLGAYAGQSVYVAIQCISSDAFILLVDDFYIGASKSTIAYNSGTSVVGKATKSISYNAKPVINPVETSYNSRNLNVELLGYNVYRDDVQINANIVEVTEYNDPEPSIATHDYFVTAVYDGGESDPSNVVTVVVTDIMEISTNSVVIYPNPSNGNFTIELKEDAIVDIYITDIAGKEVYSKTIKGSESINALGMQKGLYFVRLLYKSSNEIIIKKIIIQ